MCIIDERVASVVRSEPRELDEQLRRWKYAILRGFGSNAMTWSRECTI